MDQQIKEQYQQWLTEANADRDLFEELQEISTDEAKINDAFYRDLEFGTGGLRGVIGAGTNRMNVYTVAKASQGLANYVLANYQHIDRKIAISRDSRNKSDLFAEVAAGVFAANGIEVFIYPEIMPTPTLSFAVRDLKCAAGIMITASHNPAKYNGYKVYGDDGCQITTEAATIILAEIEKIDIFNDIKRISFNSGKDKNLIHYISTDVYTRFVEAVKSQSLLYGKKIDKDIAIVYSPLNGTGLKPVTRTLKESGYTNISVVPEQAQPDGNFPTCPYPNPEILQAMSHGIAFAKKCNADLLLATDPDCDRVGIAVKNKKGDYTLLSGNETGVLLFDYICSRRIANKKMPVNPVLAKTIVTTDMAEAIADNYGVKTVNLLTGFKFIGELIGQLEAKGSVNSYVFGFEESYGYLSGTYVRDKDGVDGAFLVCEMYAYYASQGISLLDKLDELYQKYGYTLNTLHSYEYDGADGFETMGNIMKKLRSNITSIGNKHVNQVLDYSTGIDNLPTSNVLKFLLDDHCSVVVRPSGTEPKLKMYVSVRATDRSKAKDVEHEIVSDVEGYLS